MGLANRALRELEDVGSLAQLLVATVARRHADPTDRRRVLVDLTPTAQAALDRLLSEVQQAVTAVMGALDDWASTPSNPWVVVTQVLPGPITSALTGRNADPFGSGPGLDTSSIGLSRGPVQPPDTRPPTPPHRTRRQAPGHRPS